MSPKRARADRYIGSQSQIKGLSNNHPEVCQAEASQDLQWRGGGLRGPPSLSQSPKKICTRGLYVPNVIVYKTHACSVYKKLH